MPRGEHGEDNRTGPLDRRPRDSPRHGERMIRLGTALVLGSMLVATRSSAQLPLASRSWEPAAAQVPGSLLDRPALHWATAGIASTGASSQHLLTLAPFPADSVPRHKSPVLAWFLSWVVPGGGQGYNG